MRRRTLTEEYKIEILVKYRMYGPKWTIIGKQLQINASTIKSFITSYKNHGTITPKRGRPIEITDDVKFGIIGAVENDPELSLREVNAIFDVSTTTARKILNEDGIQYLQRIQIPPLSDAHRKARVAFAKVFAEKSYRTRCHVS